MIADSINRLRYLCDTIPESLRSISEAAYTAKPVPNKSSKKEILGHLIDSATNNHQRFVRVQFEENPAIWYDQDRWVIYSAHQQTDVEQLITFWESYNRHLTFLLGQLPEERLGRPCRMKDGRTVTLVFLINDYVSHLEHHLKQLIDY
jgi:Protein of unknown function (DUF664).